MKTLVRFLGNSIRLIWRITWIATVFSLLVTATFITFKGNQPMQIAQVPDGMTYWQFMTDRVTAAREAQPARCGVGRMVTFAVLAPFYSVAYTEAGIHPDGFWARMADPDANIPKDVEGTPLYQVPDVWWQVVERVSWSMLARHAPACNLRAIVKVGPAQ